MPKLIKDDEYQGLYRRPDTGRYYVKKYISGHGNLVASLRTRDRKKAIRKMDKALDALSLSTEVLIDDMHTEVLRHYEGQADKTYESYESTWRCHLEPFFAGMPITQVGSYWDRYRATEKAKRPDRKLTHDRKHLLYILGHSHRRGVLASVPKLTLDEADKKRRRGKVLKPQDIDKLFAQANPKWKLKLAFYQAGLRSGEVSKLKFKDVDMKTGYITLRAETIKTRDSRSCAIPKDMLPEIRRRWMEGKSEYLFPHRDDPSRHETSTDKTFQKIKRRAGVDLIRHHFRHTAASAALNEGTPGPVVKKVFGMSERVLEDVYHHVDEETAQKVARVVAKKVRGKF